MNRNRRLSTAEQSMLRNVMKGVDGFDSVDGMARLGQSNLGNPAFKAQFDISFIVRYFTSVAAVYTAVAPAAINVALRTQIPTFLFGNIDFASGYAKGRTAQPVLGGTNWTYNIPFVVGKESIRDTFNANIVDAGVNAQFLPGDVVQPLTATIGANTTAFIIMRCTQVPYASLIAALNSDSFKINMLRYTIAQPAQQNQYNQQIQILKMTLFGKLLTDSISPNSMKLPEQNQAGIVDIDVDVTIDKNTTLATYINFDTVDFAWSIFVEYLNKGN